MKPSLKLFGITTTPAANPRKKKIISRDRGYHGSSIASGSLTGLPLFHAHFDLPIERIKHTMAPYYYRREDSGMTEPEFAQHCADELEKNDPR